MKSRTLAKKRITHKTGHVTQKVHIPEPAPVVLEPKPKEPRPVCARCTKTIDFYQTYQHPRGEPEVWAHVACLSTEEAEREALLRRSIPDTQRHRLKTA